MKRPVVEYQCDRCRRKWFQDKDEETAMLDAEFTSSELGVDGKRVTTTISFGVVCEKCEKAIKNYIKAIRCVKDATTRKPRKKGGSTGPEQAAKEEEGSSPPSPTTTPRLGDAAGTRPAPTGLSPSKSSEGAAARPRANLPGQS